MGISIPLYIILYFLLKNQGKLENHQSLAEEDPKYKKSIFFDSKENKTKLVEKLLNDYNNTCTILSYNNDLELYIEIVDSLILVFEDREEYEKCEKLKNKKDDSIEIINANTI